MSMRLNVVFRPTENQPFQAEVPSMTSTSMKSSTRAGSSTTTATALIVYTGRYTQADPIRHRTEELNDYLYAEANPGVRADRTGLYSLEGFDKQPRKSTRVNFAIRDLLSKMKKRPCCMGADRQDLYDWLIRPDLIIEYVPAEPNDNRCAETTSNTMLGGEAHLRLFPNAFNGTCCSLASTILHEFAHGALGDYSEAKPNQLETNCYGPYGCAGRR